MLLRSVLMTGGLSVVVARNCLTDRSLAVAMAAGAGALAVQVSSRCGVMMERSSQQHRAVGGQREHPRY
ncbi:MAG: hypothetical protein H7Y88_05265 [Phycisphaerales bacterium]|nr:hypothetical protein [Phycisphaerales bacterium]